MPTKFPSSRSYGSGVSIAAGTTSQTPKIPAIGCSCTNAAVTAGNDYYFRVCFSIRSRAPSRPRSPWKSSAPRRPTSCRARRRLHRRPGQELRDRFEAAGGEIVADETFVEGTADFSAYLNNAVAGGADVIFAPSAIAYAPRSSSRLPPSASASPILGGDTGRTPRSPTRRTAPTCRSSSPRSFDENDESGSAKEFVTGYKAWLNGNSQNLTNNGGNDVVAAVLRPAITPT